jgi:hypothetical protein
MIKSKKMITVTLVTLIAMQTVDQSVQLRFQMNENQPHHRQEEVCQTGVLQVENYNIPRQQNCQGSTSIKGKNKNREKRIRKTSIWMSWKYRY